MTEKPADEDLESSAASSGGVELWEMALQGSTARFSVDRVTSVDEASEAALEAPAEEASQAVSEAPAEEASEAASEAPAGAHRAGAVLHLPGGVPGSGASRRGGPYGRANVPRVRPQPRGDGLGPAGYGRADGQRKPWRCDVLELPSATADLSECPSRASWRNAWITSSTSRGPVPFHEIRSLQITAARKKRCHGREFMLEQALLRPMVRSFGRRYCSWQLEREAGLNHMTSKPLPLRRLSLVGKEVVV